MSSVAISLPESAYRNWHIHRFKTVLDNKYKTVQIFKGVDH